jgi:uncharacterized protein YkwD
MKTVAAVILSIFLLTSPAFAFDTVASLDDSSHFIKQLLNYINHYRETKRLKPLSVDGGLTLLAQNHTADMQRKSILSHDLFEERFKKSGHNSCVENVGWNYQSPKELFEAWKNSKGHDQNMVADDIRRAGISRIGTYVTFFACN